MIHWVLLANFGQLACVYPKVSSLYSRPETTICKQDLFHALPDHLVDPVLLWLVAFAPLVYIPPVVSPRLHESEKTHEV